MPQKWETVRVFISSTFRDMHAERDHLVRVVFPELKKRCREKRINLIDVDLRWGVSEQDAQDGKALDICLDEIDGCRPFFLGLLGHRYGWVPTGETRSITAAEIYHGALHNDLPAQVVDLKSIIDGKLEGRKLTPEQTHCMVANYLWNGTRRKYILNPEASKEDLNIIRSVFTQYAAYQKDRSFFFFRSQRLSRELAGDKPQDFFEQTQAEQGKLAALKEEIETQGLWNTGYERIEPLDEDDLEAFGAQVQNILWERIQAEVEIEDDDIDWLDEEREFHEIFMADRIRRFVGRENNLDRLHGFVEGKSNLMVVTGEPGSGKSALLARFSEQAIQAYPEYLIISHSVGASSGSTSLRYTLRRLFGEMNRHIGLDEEIPEDIRELLTQFPDKLKTAAESLPVLIILDAVNQFDRADDAQDMRWLPSNLPDNVRFVISALEGQSLDALLIRKPEILPVEALGNRDIEVLVDQFLEEVHKSFPKPPDRKSFLTKLEHGNPLYILVALEELKVFGDFDALGRRIDQLPETVAALFDQVLDRVEQDFARFPGLVRDALCLMACGRQGMTAEELQDLLSEHAPQLPDGSRPEKLPNMLMARLRLSLDAYLFERSGVLDFFHGQLKEAVGQRWLKQEKARIERHRLIANYFNARWAEPNQRALDELPHQQIKCRDWAALVGTLCDLKFIEAKCTIGLTYGLVDDYFSAKDAMGSTTKGLRQIEEFKTFFMANTHVLRQYPELTFQQAINQPDGSAPCKAVNKIILSGQIARPWLEWKNKPQHKSPCIMTLPGHIDAVESCAYSPEGRRIVSASCDNTLKVWNAENGAEIMTLSGHTGALNCCMYSPDGRHILSVSEDNTLKVWDAESSAEIVTLSGHKDRVNSCAYSPDSRCVVSASWDNTLKLWDVNSGNEIITLSGHTDRINSCAYSPDGQKVVSASKDNTLKLWDIESGNEIATLSGHTREVYSCIYSPDGRRIISASADDTIKVWDVGSYAEIVTLMCDAGFLGLCAYSPDGRQIVSTSDNNTLKVWDAESGIEITTLAGHTGLISSCMYSPDGRHIVSASGDNSLKIWDATDGTELATMWGHTHFINSCVYSPDGRYIVSASNDNTLKVWDAESGTEIVMPTGHKEGVNSCMFLPDGRHIVSASIDHTLKLWNAESGAELATMEGHTNCIYSCACSPDSRHIVSASADNNLRIWDAAKGTELTTLSGHTGFVSSCQYSPDGLQIVSASGDDTFKVWDAKSGIELAASPRHLEVIPRCVYSPDGRHIVSISDKNTLKLWDVESGTEIATLWGHTDLVGSCAYSPDGRRLVSASWDNTLKVWDANSGVEIATLTGHTNVVNACACSPDGHHVVSTSWDNTLKVWDANSGIEIFTLSGHTGQINSFAYSPDGRCVVSVSNDGALKVWNTESGATIATFIANSELKSCDLSASEQIVAGGRNGNIYLLALKNYSFTDQLLTPVKLYRSKIKRWDSNFSSICKFCGTRFVPEAKIIDTISVITRHLTPEQSPCAELPAEAWDEPNLKSQCPHCKKPVRFNPFIVDNSFLEPPKMKKVIHLKDIR